ncbi:MAG: hypothetical protein VB027_04170 [Gordonibacter sp.]|nr:hypothetical protein [Gordonibacter sp.]
MRIRFFVTSAAICCASLLFCVTPCFANDDTLGTLLGDVPDSVAQSVVAGSPVDNLLVNKQQTDDSSGVLAASQTSSNTFALALAEGRSDASALALAPVAAVEVSTADELRTAFARAVDGTVIKMMTNIDLGETGLIFAVADATLTLDLNGHTLSYVRNGNWAESAIVIGSSDYDGNLVSSSFVVTDSGSGGLISTGSTKNAAIKNAARGAIVIEGGTIASDYMSITSTNGGDVTIGACTLRGAGDAIYMQAGVLSIEEGATILQEGPYNAIWYYCGESHNGGFSMTGGSIVSTVDVSVAPVYLSIAGQNTALLSGGSIVANQSPALLLVGVGNAVLSGSLSLVSSNIDQYDSSNSVLPGAVYAYSIDSSGFPLTIDGATIENTKGGIAVLNDSRSTVMESDSLNVKGSILNLTLTPETNNATVGKISDGEGSFVLSNADTFDAATDWRVYDDAATTTTHPSVTASLVGDVITLSDSGGNLALGTYYLAAVDGGRAESRRLALTIEEAYVAIGDIRYPTLQDAFATVEDGETITLLRDVVYSGKTLQVSGLGVGEKTITFDLNGKALECGGYASLVAVDNGAHLVIRDSSMAATGKIVSRSSSAALAVGGVSVARATLESGTIEVVSPYGYALSVGEGSSVIMKSGMMSSSGWVVTNKGSFTLQGGVIKGVSNSNSDRPLMGSGFDGNNVAATFVIEGGSVIDAGSNCAFSLGASSAFLMTAGSIEAAGLSAIKSKGAPVSVSGGSITSEGPFAILALGKGCVSISQASASIPTNIVSTGTVTNEHPVAATILVWPKDAEGAYVLDVRGGTVANRSQTVDACALCVATDHPLYPDPDYFPPIPQGTGLVRIDAAATLEGSVLPLGVPAIATTTLPSSTAGVAYETTLSTMNAGVDVLSADALSGVASEEGVSPSAALAANNSDTLVWSVLSGALPSGLVLSEGGVISGTPSASGTFEVGIKVENALGYFTKTFTLEVASAPADPSDPGSVSPSAPVAKNTLIATGDHFLWCGIGLGCAAAFSVGLVFLALRRCRS